MRDSGEVIGDRVDFFVSHAGSDEGWAEWVAWQLAEAGYTVELDVWDWAAGQNFITKISHALERCDRVVALWSAEYFARSRYTTAEWSAVAVTLPGGRPGRMVPLRVEDVPDDQIPGILKPLVYRDLFGLDQDEARRVVLEAIRGPARPDTAPIFPGRGQTGRLTPRHEMSSQLPGTSPVHTALAQQPDLPRAKGATPLSAGRWARSCGDVTDIGGVAEEVTTKPRLPVTEITDAATKRVATVAPRGLGVKGIDGSDPLAMTDPSRARQIIVHLLSASTALPADTGPFTFQTSIENQRMVEIEVWEQTGAIESQELSENRKIGNAVLKRLPPRLPAHAPIEITFFVSEAGELSVEAVEPGSGTSLQFALELS